MASISCMHMWSLPVNRSSHREGLPTWNKGLSYGALRVLQMSVSSLSPARSPDPRKKLTVQESLGNGREAFQNLKGQKKTLLAAPFLFLCRCTFFRIFRG